MQTINRLLDNGPAARGWKKWVVAAGLLGWFLYNREIVQATVLNLLPLQHRTVGKLKVTSHLKAVPPHKTSGKKIKHKHVKIRRFVEQAVPVTDTTIKNKEPLTIFRDTSASFSLSHPAELKNVDLNATTELQGFAGGVVVIRRPLPVRLYNRYIKWPIKRFFQKQR